MSSRAPAHGGGQCPQRGVALLDALAACLVLALGLQGLLWFQLQLIGTGRSAQAQLQASRLAEDLYERLQGQSVPAVRAGLVAGAEPAAGQDCRLAPCLAAELRQWHLAQWRQHLGRQLPLGSAEGFPIPDDARQLGLRLAWRDAGFQAVERPEALGPGRAAWPLCPPQHWCNWIFGVL